MNRGDTDTLESRAKREWLLVDTRIRLIRLVDDCLLRIANGSPNARQLLDTANDAIETIEEIDEELNLEHMEEPQ